MGAQPFPGLTGNLRRGSRREIKILRQIFFDNAGYNVADNRFNRQRTVAEFYFRHGLCGQPLLKIFPFGGVFFLFLLLGKHLGKIADDTGRDVNRIFRLAFFRRRRFGNRFFRRRLRFWRRDFGCRSNLFEGGINNFGFLNRFGYGIVINIVGRFDQFFFLSGSRRFIGICIENRVKRIVINQTCLLYTSPSPRD